MRKEKNQKDDKIEKMIKEILERSPNLGAEEVDTKSEKEILDAISKLDILYEINIVTGNTSEARLCLERRMQLVNELRLMREG